MKNTTFALAAAASLFVTVFALMSAQAPATAPPAVGPIGLHEGDSLETPEFRLTVAGWESAGEDAWLVLKDGGWLGQTYRINTTKFATLTVHCPHER